MPYLRYSIQRPVDNGRDLDMEIYSYICVVNINIVGNSIEQVRTLSSEITKIFDKQITVAEFPNIEDVSCDEAEESKSYDSSTKREIFETAQAIRFNYVL